MLKLYIYTFNNHNNNSTHAIMKTQKERLLTFINYLGLSKRAFERSIGVSLATVTNAKDKLSYGLIEKTISTYPILNRIWLLTGNGEMIINQERTISDYVTNNGDVSGQNFGSGTQVITSQADPEELQKLRDRVHELEIENAKLQGMIEILKQK